ncbi:MAG: hypothetical protein HGB12_01700 [Bacteroidetes bacterium]|nr:hypothetical protein [Bacteroidota bacterium]
MKKTSIFLFVFCITFFAYSIAGNTNENDINNTAALISVGNSSLSSSPAAALIAPVATAGSGATGTQFTANWNTSVDATSYRLDVSTSISFTSFVTGFNNYNAGNVTSYNVTGLTGQTTYYYRVRAENTCNSSINSNTITYNTIFECGSTLVINHVAGNVAPVDKTVNYGTLTTSLSGESKCWITQNLGSTNQATSATDATEPSAGWYWQFNRKQGFKHDGTTRTPNTTWITTISETSDWLPANDPCTIELGTAWRIPTNTEWFNADATGGWVDYDNDATGTYGSVLKIHGAGRLDVSNGSLSYRGSDGWYWSSVRFNDPSGRNVNIGSGNCAMNDYNKAYGFSLRCIKD